MNPVKAESHKKISKLILSGLTFLMYCLYVFIAVMLLNSLINYFFKIIVMLPSIVSNRPAQDMGFKMQYLLSANGHMPGYIILMLAVLMMSTFGRRLVLSSAQKIYSMLPFEVTKSTVDGSSKWKKAKDYKACFEQIDNGAEHPPKCVIHWQR